MNIPITVQPRRAQIIVHTVVQELFQLLSNPAVCNDNTMDWPGGFPGAPLPAKKFGHVYDEVSSGKAWRNTHASLNIKDHKEVMIGILGACDKAVTDKFGKLALEPFMFTLANILRAFRNHVAAWRIAGYLINQTLAQYKDSDDKLQDYHDALQEVIRAFRDLEAGRGIAWIFFHKGKAYPVILQFVLLCIIGDTIGHDKLCCRMESRTLGTACMCRHCDIPTMETDNAEYRFSYRILPKMAYCRHRPQAAECD
jgi:Plavaka transposase